MVVVSDFLKDNLFCLLSIKTKWRGRYWSILILPRVDLVSSFFQMLTQVKLTTAKSSLPFFCPMKQSGFCFLISVCLKYSTISKVLWILSLEFFLHILILHNTLLQTIISSPLQMTLHTSYLLKASISSCSCLLKNKKILYDLSQAAILFMIVYNLIKFTCPAIFPTTLHLMSYI